MFKLLENTPESSLWPYRYCVEYNGKLILPTNERKSTERYVERGKEIVKTHGELPADKMAEAIIAELCEW